ncbi:acetyl-CoA C-acyltransferase family protein [Arhodomonas sp. KWT2]|uniref:acetyl-CoA C-acyltransferase family protein n=1 Tax=unclassified Arhodomonas TaxID=2621637 RepID=UPI0013D6F46B|nr:acetyl-CoA C-acyltransferase family protein [Arhodomonas sp. KWT]
MQDVVVVSGVRTPVGSYGGALKDVPLGELAASVVRESVARAGVSPEAVGHTVFGNVIHTEPRDMYLARVASVNGGLPVTTPALTLNRLCGSGLQAILTAADYIRTGDADCTVAGGGDAMSRAPYWLPSGRWGQRMGDGQMLDAMVGALTDPFDKCHMGITAENVAEKWGISREDQDALATESHRRAAAAIDAGHFREQILPVEIRGRKGTVTVDTDEGPRRDIDTERMAAMKPVFKRDGGTVTAGNASTLNDGAAAVVLASREAAERQGLKPRARLVAGTVAAVDPRYMGIGPVPAVRQLLERTGVATGDVDTWEINEAFAAQALAVVRDLGLDPARVNPNGSGISLGHPIGATGAILTVKAIHELERICGRYAVVTMCIGGGQGIAALFEHLD